MWSRRFQSQLGDISPAKSHASRFIIFRIPVKIEPFSEFDAEPSSHFYNNEPKSFFSQEKDDEFVRLLLKIVFISAPDYLRVLSGNSRNF